MRDSGGEGSALSHQPSVLGGLHTDRLTHGVLRRSFGITVCSAKFGVLGLAASTPLGNFVSQRQSTDRTARGHEERGDGWGVGSLVP